MMTRPPAGSRGSCRTLMETWTGIKGRSHSLCGKENRCLLAADGCEAGFQIGKDIINVLGADGQADGVLVDLLLGQLGIGQLAVSGGGRVDDKALHVRYVGQQREDLQVVDELECFLTAALDVEGEDGSAAVGEVLLIQGVVGVVRQAGVVDLLHLGVMGQVLHDLLGVLDVAVQAQGERLGALQQQERVERADAEKDFMGLLTFKGNHPTLMEAKTAKNYLDDKELRAMGQLVSGYLDFAERQAEREQPMTMNDWAAYLDRILTMSGEKLLQGSGSVSHEDAMEHATNEYRKYKQRTISDVEHDYLLSIKTIEDLGKKGGTQ